VENDLGAKLGEIIIENLNFKLGEIIIENLNFMTQLDNCNTK